MKYHSVVTIIKKLLEDRDLWYESFEHGSVRTSEEAAKLRDGYTLQQGAKALIVRIKYSKQKREFAMLVFPANRRFNSKLAKKVIGAKDIRFASEEEVKRITAGVEVGGIPPFGNVFYLPVFVDPTLFENEKIVFNAGDRRFSIGMKSQDYQTLVKPHIVSIVDK